MPTKINALNAAVCGATGLTPQDVGVSVGDWLDKSTWVVNFVVVPSALQVQQAAGAIVAFNAGAIIADDAIDAMDQLMLKVLFNHENRIRVLEAKPPLTVNQFKAALRQL